MNHNTAAVRGFLNIPDGTWTRLALEVERCARQFTLNEDEKDELFAALRHKIFEAAYRVRLNPKRACLKTYLETVIHNALKDWKDAKAKEKPTKDDRERIRRILYAPTRYGIVSQMLKQIDFNLAKLELTDHERDILDRALASTPIKEIGKGMGIGKNRILREWAGIKGKLATYYGKRLIQAGPELGRSSIS